MRDAAGRLRLDWNGPAIERFRRNCEFDPATGCVLWTGGTTAGHAHHARYGAFWFEGRRWAAHRWSAKHIHGFDIEGRQVDHCCPLWRHGGDQPLQPNTLCVEHVKPLGSAVNRALQTVRGQICAQGVVERRHWIYVQVGLIDPPPEYEPVEGGIPLYVQPAWLPMAASAELEAPF